MAKTSDSCFYNQASFYVTHCSINRKRLAYSRVQHTKLAGRTNPYSQVEFSLKA